MPSSITLTVAHLPTSTSFFISALQPLHYAYRGRTGQTIGFGSFLDPSTPPDFWITQEVPGIPAGAAHVAFNAPSQNAVQDFFLAALKAGGKIHGEPCVRDASGYYSAAVIDFDGNSIEAVHRPSFSDDKENNTKSMVSHTHTVARALSAARNNVSKAPSAATRTTVSRAPSETRSAAPPPQNKSGDIIDNLLAEARNAADVARGIIGQARSQNPATSSQGGGNRTNVAVVGTLLGVAAGAALHHALSNSSNSSSGNRPLVSGRSITEPPTRSEHNAYSPRAIEGPPSSFTPRMITMRDNDYCSEYVSSVHPAASSRNTDSGIASPFGNTGESTASRSSRKTSTRMIESPPTSYRAPTILTSTSSKRDKDTRNSASSSSRSRRRSHSSSERTVVRITETLTSAARHPLPANTPISRTPNTSSRKTSKTALRDQEPEEYPLPVSRASTWAGESVVNKSHRGSALKTKSSRISTVPSESVVGKTKDVKKLDLPSGELTPDDSISQISVNTRKSRRSGR